MEGYPPSEATMTSPLLFILVLASWICLLQTADAIALREYCDNQIYKRANSPRFLWNPRLYILAYYKRCIHHDDWVDCIIHTRENRPKGVEIERFERNFPPKFGMQAAGIVFCDMKLHKVPPNNTKCEFNSTMCNEVYEKGDKCLDSASRANCLWGQLVKCDYNQMYPLYVYEYGLLGGRCLAKVKKPVYPHARSLTECDESSSATVRLTPHTSSTILCILTVVVVTITLSRPGWI